MDVAPGIRVVNVHILMAQSLVDTEGKLFSDTIEHSK